MEKERERRTDRPVSEGLESGIVETVQHVEDGPEKEERTRRASATEEKTRREELFSRKAHLPAYPESPTVTGTKLDPGATVARVSKSRRKKGRCEHSRRRGDVSRASRRKLWDVENLKLTGPLSSVVATENHARQGHIDDPSSIGTRSSREVGVEEESHQKGADDLSEPGEEVVESPASDSEVTRSVDVVTLVTGEGKRREKEGKRTEDISLVVHRRRNRGDV